MLALRLAVRIALVACLIASTQGLLMIQGAFHANRAAIAEAFCVNTARPELGCEGSCELRKRMEAHRKGETEKAAAVLDVSLAVAATETAPLALALPPHSDEPDGPEARGAHARGERSGVFRPPRGRA